MESIAKLRLARQQRQRHSAVTRRAAAPSNPLGEMPKTWTFIGKIAADMVLNNGKIDRKNEEKGIDLTMIMATGG